MKMKMNMNMSTTTLPSMKFVNPQKTQAGLERALNEAMTESSDKNNPARACTLVMTLSTHKNSRIHLLSCGHAIISNDADLPCGDTCVNNWAETPEKPFACDNCTKTDTGAGFTVFHAPGDVRKASIFDDHLVPMNMRFRCTYKPSLNPETRYDDEDEGYVNIERNTIVYSDDKAARGD